MYKIISIFMIPILSFFMLMPVAGATTINFDDLPETGIVQLPVPANYAGIEWFGWDYFSLWGRYDHPIWIPHSLEVAVESFTNENLMKWPFPVNFNGAWFSGKDYATMTFEGYLNGVLQATSATLIPSSTPQFLAANFGTMVDAVRVISPVPAYTIMDDVTFNEDMNAIPEPASLSLFGLGLLGLIFRRKKS